MIICMYAPCVLAVDTNPPTPDPATFASGPTAISETEITMTATLGTDPNTPIEYYFACVAGGGNDRIWQIDPSYTDSGLSPVTLYAYTVQMRDVIGNTGAASAPPSSATTLDTTPPTPDPATFATGPMAISETEITMSATLGTDLSGSVEYYFACVAGGGNDRDWSIDPNYTDSGLTPDTLYDYTVQMRDSVSNVTGTTSASATTDPDIDPPSPDPASFATAPTATGETSITMTAALGSDLLSEPVEYLFIETTGNPGATSSIWQAGVSHTDTGLDPNTLYTYIVQMRDSVGNVTGTTSASATTDPDTTAPTPDPADFATAPTALSETEITMTATTGSEAFNGPVEYLFTETTGNPGATSSVWQISEIYNDTGLSPDTLYDYTVQMRDALGNLTATTSASATTDPDTAPPTPDPAAFVTAPTATSETEITMTAATGSDIFSEPVEYYFAETSGNTGGSDSGWQSDPNYADSELDPVTQYAYTVQMRDALGNTGTASAPPSNATTLDTTPPTPTTASFATMPVAMGETEINMVATAGADISGPVQYYFDEISGNPGGSDSGWVTDPDYTDTALSPNVQYIYTVQMRDSFDNTGNASGPASATTDASFLHAISGYVLDTFDGAPVPDVLVSASVGGGASVTASDGFYSLLVPEGFSGSVTPMKAGSYYHQFTPDERTYSNVTSNIANEDYDGDRLGPYNVNYFTELFDSADNDLSYQMFTFVPSDSRSYYLLCVDDITDFPTDPSGGATLSLADNSFQQVNLVGGLKVKIYGHSYGSFMVGSNGYITFDSGDTNELEAVTDHFSQKRISGLFIDLNPPATGTVSWQQLSDRAVVTFENVSEQGITNSNNFQVEMFFDGTIILSYLNIDAQYGLAGLSAGYGKPTDYAERALSGYHICADIDADYKVGIADFAAMAMYWLDPACSDSIECKVSDLDRSGEIDAADLYHFMGYWLDEKSLPPPLTIKEIFYSQAANDGRMWGNNSGVLGTNNYDLTDKALVMGGRIGYGYRSIVSFDTSSLPDICTISSVALKLTCGREFGTDPFAQGSWAGASYIDIATPSFANIGLDTDDWDEPADAYDIATFDVTASPPPGETMTSTDFNIAGLTNISKTGTTQLRLGFANLYGTEHSYRGFYSGEASENYAPKLIIQYLITPPQ